MKLSMSPEALSDLDPPTRLTVAQQSALSRLLRPVTPERVQARELANFPNGVTFRRNADFNSHTLLALDNTTPVPVSIDPFFFKVSA